MSTDCVITTLQPPYGSPLSDGKLRLLRYRLQEQPDVLAISLGNLTIRQILNCTSDERGRVYVLCTVKERKFAIVCLDQSLALATDFGENGVAHIEFQDWRAGLHTLSVQGQRIVTMGNIFTLEGNSVNDMGIAIAVLSANGRLDTSFSGDGKLAIYKKITVNGGCIDVDGGILFTGAESYNLLLGRLTRDGEFDRGFAAEYLDTNLGPGILSWHRFEQYDPTKMLHYQGTDVKLDASGRILVAGYVARTFKDHQERSVLFPCPTLVQRQ